MLNWIPVTNRRETGKIANENIICFSHLRWDFVYQRPQHLLSRAAANANVYVFEEPLAEMVPEPILRITRQPEGIQVLTPLLPYGFSASASIAAQRMLLTKWIENSKITNFIAWYYTPMALLFSDHLHPEVTVYDCMDELSAFDGAPSNLLDQEQILFDRADVVFAGGHSLYEAKLRQHSNVHFFPSSIDRAHFATGRSSSSDPEDQRNIPHPRIGFFGVLDERLDRKLLAELAKNEPDLQFILIGPVVKIREEDLPRAHNIHYLGQKAYRDLPTYLANWEVAIMPFALNASTRFISPTKTPEYLAAGKPVVSTPICDVVSPYGKLGLARIASNAQDFATAIRTCLEPPTTAWQTAVDLFLRSTSWDKTFNGMWAEVIRCKSEEPVSSLSDLEAVGISDV